jgi:Zn-dependent M28 family amino/carboxypeptidase
MEARDVVMKPVPKRRWTRLLVTRRALLRIGVLLAVLVLLVLGLGWYGTAMPGRSYRGALPALTVEQKALSTALEAHVRVLAGEIGARSMFWASKQAQSAKYLRDQLRAAGYAEVQETFAERGGRTPNLEVVLTGTKPGLACVVIGAHYDAYQGTPGADDNASGCAGVLEIARMMARSPGERTVRFVLFTNEEPPTFQTANMGSLVYAKDLQQRGIKVHAMLSLESIGYYRTEAGSQKYPLAGLGQVYPDTGDFIAFVGDLGSRSLVRRAIGAFREYAKFPSEGVALPGDIAGVGWSDHWAFWQTGVEAIMVTGTAPFRNPNYHQETDTPETLDYERMSRVVEGLAAVVRDLAKE